MTSSRATPPWPSPSTRPPTSATRTATATGLWVGCTKMKSTEIYNNSTYLHLVPVARARAIVCIGLLRGVLILLDPNHPKMKGPTEIGRISFCCYTYNVNMKTFDLGKLFFVSA